MLRPFAQFVQQVLVRGKFRITQFDSSAYQALLTATEHLVSSTVVMIPSLIEWAKQHPGCLLIDDTSHPKYGLKQWARKLYIPASGGYLHGFKIVLFLWVCDSGRYPIGFALWKRLSPPITQLALKGLSLLRNTFGLKPRYVFADGAYSTNDIFKRLTDYGWPCVMRFKNDRKLDGESIRRLIPRGYGEISGYIHNGTKLKVIRHKKHFVATNRMLLERHVLKGLYACRWKIEEVFRAMKTIIGLNGCQQVSVRAQVIYLVLCMLLFSCLEAHSPQTPYKIAQSVISGETTPSELTYNKIFLPF